MSAADGGFWPAVVEEISVAKGYEAALGAALGDDLDASTNASAPAHWALSSAEGDPALPPGVEALAKHVSAPPALARRLAQIGVVRGGRRRLRAQLKPGQRLVSKEGDLWRWDGFIQAAEAPTPAARRLAEKNRLGDLQDERPPRAKADALKSEAEQIGVDRKRQGGAESEARQAHRDALRDVEVARERACRRAKKAQVAARLSALEEAELRLIVNRDEARDKRAKAEADLAASRIGRTHAQLDAARAAAAQDRAAAAEARAELQAHQHESETRTKRRRRSPTSALMGRAPRTRAVGQIGELQARLEEIAGEREKLADAPDEFLHLRRTLLNKIEAAEAARSTASDTRASAETRLAEVDRAARASNR